LVESLKLIASQPFADIDKQAGIKNRLSGKRRKPAKVLQVNVFLYHFYGTPVIQTELVLDNQSRYHRADVYTFTPGARIKLPAINGCKRIPGNQCG